MRVGEVKKLFKKLNTELDPGKSHLSGYKEIVWQLSLLRHDYPQLYEKIRSMRKLEEFMRVDSE